MQQQINQSEGSFERTDSITRRVVSWLCVAVICVVFLRSLPYKFSGSAETQHIFSTIGKWLGGFLGNTIGGAFTNWGAWIIGSAELVTSLLLLFPVLYWLFIRNPTASNARIRVRRRLHAIGGLMAAALMGGAVFFHLASRLGINVNNDNGALFYSAVIVFLLGILLFLLNRSREGDEQSTAIGRVLRSLKPRSWKHWLFWVECIPLLALVVIGLFLGFFFHQVNSDRYTNLDVETVPVFERVVLPFIHQYTKEESLPFIGSAAIDIDNDGIDEIFIGGGLGQSDVLYAYQKDGSFKDISSESDIGHQKQPETFGAAVLDIDENGFNDLVLAREDDVYIAFNNNGRFEETKLNLPFNEVSAPLTVALGDIDKDGYVDMYIGAYIRNEFVAGQTGFNDPDYGASSLLFLNNGDNTFTDITATAGMTYIHNTFQGNFIDLDLDNDVDLVVSHDTGQVRTWRNDTVVSATGAGAESIVFTNMPNPSSDEYGYPMGNAIGDYNNDGYVDLAFSNVGNLGPLFNRVVRGDLNGDQVFNGDILLFRNDGNFSFTDAATDVNLSDYEFSWGMLFEDLNADGRQDLVMSQNYVQLPVHKLFKLPGRVLLQTADGKFTDREKESNAFNKAFELATIATDFNRDGALDMVRVNLQGQSIALISGGHGNRYLSVALPNVTKSLGAVVTAQLQSGGQLVKHFVTGEGLGSDSNHELYFGLGKDDTVTSLEVVFLDGQTVRIDNPGFNKRLTIEN